MLIYQQTSAGGKQLLWGGKPSPGTSLQDLAPLLGTAKDKGKGFHARMASEHPGSD